MWEWTARAAVPQARQNPLHAVRPIAWMIRSGRPHSSSSTRAVPKRPIGASNWPPSVEQFVAPLVLTDLELAADDWPPRASRSALQAGLACVRNDCSRTLVHGPRRRDPQLPRQRTITSVTSPRSAPSRDIAPGSCRNRPPRRSRQLSPVALRAQPSAAADRSGCHGPCLDTPPASTLSQSVSRSETEGGRTFPCNWDRCFVDPEVEVRPRITCLGGVAENEPVPGGRHSQDYGHCLPRHELVQGADGGEPQAVSRMRVIGRRPIIVPAP